MRVAVVGGGISGVTAAWQLARLGVSDVVLFEASGRLGGIVETVRRDGFVVEAGPDGWVSEKPWAAELAVELGLGEELVGSKDAGRVTYIVQSGQLVAMPGGMRLMVPTDLSALNGSPLFSDAARAAYAGEAERAAALRIAAPDEDECIAAFVRRHFGEEVLRKIAGPLLGGVFGGDVERLSVRAVMPQLVALERARGSLVQALEGTSEALKQTVFTSLASGCGTLIDRLAAGIPAAWLRLSTQVHEIERVDTGWQVRAAGEGAAEVTERFDAVLLAAPAHGTQRLLKPVSWRAAELLNMDASSAVLAAFAFDEEFDLPAGFGFLVPEGEGSELLAGTFVDQKYPGRVPPGGHLLRGFFGGRLAVSLATTCDSEIAARTLRELRSLLGDLPEPRFSVVRRWPSSLPQYEVGHRDRMAELDALIGKVPGLYLLGNAYRGVGLPDLVRDARAVARNVCRVG